MTKVEFGGVSAQNFTINSATEISATSPAHGVGTVGVTVTSPSGTSNAVAFEYINNPPVISSFVVTPNPAQIGEEVTFTWELEDPDGDTLVCQLDFGDGFDIQVIDECQSNNSILHSYIQGDDFAVKLTVTDESNISEEINDTVVVDGSAQMLPFNGASVQTAWQLVQARLELSPYEFEFNLLEAAAYQYRSGTLIIVPEQGKYNYITAVTIGGEVVEIVRYAFNATYDVLFISDILRTRNIRLDMFSQYAEPLSSSKRDELTQKLLSLYDPSNIFASLSTNSSILSPQASDCVDCSKERSAYGWAITGWVISSIELFGNK